MSTVPPKDGDPRGPMTMVVLAFGSILVFVIILALQALFFNAEEAERRAKTFGSSEELSKLRATQLDRLHSYRWVDASKGVAAIPIERAMELTVRDQGRNPATTAGTAPGPGHDAGTPSPGAGR